MPTKSLPNTGAVSGLTETLDFFSDLSFAQRRFETYGDVFATKLLAQPIVFIRGERAISDLFSQSESLEGWWPESVKQLLGSRSLTKLLKAMGWLNEQQPALPDPSGRLAERTKRAIQAGNQGPIQKGPRGGLYRICLLYTSPSPRDGLLSRMPSSA